MTSSIPTSEVCMPKRLSILGDSISTFTGYIPSGNVSYYPKADDTRTTKVTVVSDCWWRKLQMALGMSLLVNNSYSGSRVSKGGSTAQADNVVGCGSRCVSLHTGSGTSQVDPDIIIVYMGINDFNNNVGEGEYDGTSVLPTSNPLPSTFREAYAVMLNKMLTAYPHAEIWVCTLPQYTDAAFPTNNSSIALAEYNKAIKQLAAAFGVKVLDWNASGLNWHSSDNLHPDKYNHSVMANYAISQLEPSVKVRYKTSA